MQKRKKKKKKKKAKKEKTSNKNETPIKLNGLTRPMSVTKELSSFLNKPLDTKMSRVGTAKEVAKYIKKKKVKQRRK